MADAEQSKSEPATPFKLQRARERGSVARGTDLGFLTGLATFSAYVWFVGPSLQAQLVQATTSALVAAPGVLASPNEILVMTGAILASMARPLVWMAVTIFMIVLVFELLQTGVVFTGEALRPDFSRLNPATGLKRVFSLRLLIETAKSLLKMAVYVGLAYTVIRTARTVSLAAITDAASLADAMARLAFRMLTLFVAAAALFAVLDQFVVRRDYQKRMRMSRRDVRREMRDREGEPRMKQRRKQLHREFVKLSESLRNIKDADVLIINPTHFAVALKYDSRSMAAPMVVSQGSHQFALRLKRLAFIYGVVIIQDAALARNLYHRCALNREVPEVYYRQVADIYTNLRDNARRNKSSKVDV
ncbi:MAG: EscU/YscU/HrcU family type III secretion system export apparatus switch protein [Phenylobacterium sp.]